LGWTESEKYALHPFPVSEIKYLRRHTPVLGWHYIIIVLKSGVSLPPLYFHLGGVRRFLSTLRQQVSVIKSEHDSNCYIVNDLADEFQKQLALAPDDNYLENLKSALLWPSSGETEKPPKVADADHAYIDPTSFFSKSHTFVEKAFEITRVAYDTTSSFVNEKLRCTFSSAENGEDASASASGDTSATPKRDSSGRDSLSKEHTDVGDFELVDTCTVVNSIREIRNRPRPSLLGSEEWGAFQDSQGRVNRVDALKERIFYGGVEKAIRSEVYAFLLGYMPFDSTRSERAELKKRKAEDYHQLKAQWEHISDSQALRFSKYRERATQIDKDVIRTDSDHPFYRGSKNKKVQKMRRILMTYAFYNFDLGYCQGMSDLLAPLLFTVRDEADTFWCFVGLMDRMERNFDFDQSGMHNQLLALGKLVQLLDPQLHAHFESQECQNFFFCFKWVLLHFKREFSFEQTLRLWESFWSCTFCEQFHLFLCVSVLQQFRHQIIESDMGTDELIVFTNSLEGKIPLDDALRNAEILCRFAGEAGQEVLTSIAPLR